MLKKTIRVFIGNLPPDTDEENLRGVIQKYAYVTSVEIKRRNDCPFAFVNLNDSPFNLDSCFEKLSQKKWKGYQLTVQMAKESFLERLARERLENQNDSVQNTTVPATGQQEASVYVKNQTNPSSHATVHKISERNLKKSNNNDSDSSVSSDEEITKNRQLRMFAGTKLLSDDVEERKVPKKVSKPNLRGISMKKFEEEKEILGKFEMFNSVWKDTCVDLVEKHVKNGAEYASKKREKASTNFSHHTSISNMEDNMRTVNSHSVGLQSQEKQLNVKVTEAEERRVKAMDDRQKELLKRKQVIKYALTSVHNSNRANKRTVFEDDNVNNDVHTERNSKRNKNERLELFSDEEMECNSSNDFRIRNQFEGEKGQSLLAMQARYGNDKRFTLDERFMESDGEEEKRSGSVDRSESGGEREKLFRILGCVLGREIPDTNKAKQRHSTKVMLRYDPTKPDHVKFEIKENSAASKLKKKTEDVTTDKSIAVNENVENVPSDLPVVSKEKYYKVSDTLQQTLQSSEQKFSLLEMFSNDDIMERDADDNFDVRPIINKRKEWSHNRFNDSSGSEDETDYKKHIAVDHSDENFGVRQECLFFDKNDARFLEGLQFINHINEEYVESFSEIRKALKTIVKKKIVNNRKKEGKWRKQLGGKKKNPVSDRHKSNFRRR